jgi:hypothetical protein
MLSLVPRTGWSDQIWLVQIALIGAGAFALVEWGLNLGSIGGLRAAAAFAVPFGVLMALPTLAGNGIGHNPTGVIPTVGGDVRATRARRRAEQAKAAPPSTATLGV